MISTMNHDEEDPGDNPWPDTFADPSRCCDEHGLLCELVDLAEQTCCPKCPEWQEKPIWH